MSDEDTLTTNQLAARWHLAPVTIHQWRVFGRGPEFVKTGRKVRYKLEDVREYEQTYKMGNTAQYALVAHKKGRP